MTLKEENTVTDEKRLPDETVKDVVGGSQDPEYDSFVANNCSDCPFLNYMGRSGCPFEQRLVFGRLQSEARMRMEMRKAGMPVSGGRPDMVCPYKEVRP